MRRRSFRPGLESLDLRVTPSEVIGYGMTAPGPASPYTPIYSGTGAQGSDHPLWNTPTDPTLDPDDDFNIWCPDIGE